MANKISRYMKLFFLFTRINYVRAMEYRVDFITGFIPSLFYSFGYLFFIGAIVSRTPIVEGWDLKGMILLFATSQILYYGAWLFYRNSLDYFIDSVRDGTFDFVLKLPADARFTTSIKYQSPNFLISFLGIAALGVYIALGYHLTFLSIIMYLFLLVCGFLIYYNVIFILVTWAFWIIDASDLIWFADDMTRYGSYPMKVFPPVLGLIFSTVLPVLLIIYVPVTALLNILDWKLVIVSVVVLILTTFLSGKFWQLGLRHYSSASS